MTTNLYKIYTTDTAVKDSIDRMVENLKEKNVPVFARIDYAKASELAGLSLFDEELIIFGDIKMGNILVKENPLFGIDIPLKILAWREKDKTKVAHYNMELLAKQLNMHKSKEVIKNLDEFLRNLVTSSVKVTEI
jgi:uncharacterized protein (DUF302 family)